MKVIEKVLIVMVVVGYILQFFSLPLENFTIFISLISSAFFYFLFSFALFEHIGFGQIFKKEAYDSIKSYHAIYTVYCGFALSVLLLGLMSSILHYEKSAIMLYLGVCLLGMVLIFTAIKFFQRRTTFYKAILVRAVIFAILFGLHFFIV